MNQECITTCQYVTSNRNYFKTLSIQQFWLSSWSVLNYWLAVIMSLKTPICKVRSQGPWLIMIMGSNNPHNILVACHSGAFGKPLKIDSVLSPGERGRIKAISASGQLLSPLARIIYWCYRLPPLQFQASWISQPMPYTSTSVTWMRLPICILHLFEFLCQKVKWCTNAYH